MGEERIRIESYDMPEGKYLHPQDIRLLLPILFDYPLHPASASNMSGGRGSPRWWKGSSHFFAFKYKRLYRHEDEGHRLYPESERREA